MILLLSAVEAQLEVFELGLEVDPFDAFEKVHFVVKVWARLEFALRLIVLAVGLIQQLLCQSFIGFPELFDGVE